MTFEQWMDKVDSELEVYCGLSHMDLADQHYHDWYEEEMSPEDAAREALENEGFHLFVDDIVF